MQKVAKCNCKGAWLYNEIPLPKTDLKNECAGLKKTLEKKDGTCKFCEYFY